MCSVKDNSTDYSKSHYKEVSRYFDIFNVLTQLSSDGSLNDGLVINIKVIELNRTYQVTYFKDNLHIFPIIK